MGAAAAAVVAIYVEVVPELLGIIAALLLVGGAISILATSPSVETIVSENTRTTTIHRRWLWGKSDTNTIGFDQVGAIAVDLLSLRLTRWYPSPLQRHVVSVVPATRGPNIRLTLEAI